MDDELSNSNPHRNKITVKLIKNTVFFISFVSSCLLIRKLPIPKSLMVLMKPMNMFTIAKVPKSEGVRIRERVTLTTKNSVNCVIWVRKLHRTAIFGFIVSVKTIYGNMLLKLIFNFLINCFSLAKPLTAYLYR